MSLETSTGFGLEQEGFILTPEGDLVTTLFGKLSSEWLLKKVQTNLPQAADLCSLEQAAGHFELKTHVRRQIPDAIADLFDLRYLINQLLPSGSQLIFTPVPPKPFEFVPATNDPESRAQMFYAKFQDRPDLIRSAVTSSLQLNTSVPFANTNLTLRQQLEIARTIHDHFAINFDQATIYNDTTLVDSTGMTRLDHALRFITAAKASSFTWHGIDATEAAKPKPFHTLDAMLKRMIICSNASSFEGIDPKDFHSLFGKPRWFSTAPEINPDLDSKDCLVVFETRCSNAEDDEARVLEVCNHMMNMISEALTQQSVDLEKMPCSMSA